MGFYSQPWQKAFTIVEGWDSDDSDGNVKVAKFRTQVEYKCGFPGWIMGIPTGHSAATQFQHHCHHYSVVCS